MREISVREASQNFSKVIADAERGETTIITKNGVPVAKISPQPADPRDDPEWRAGFARMLERLARKPDLGMRVGVLSEEDKYG